MLITDSGPETLYLLLHSWEGLECIHHDIGGLCLLGRLESFRLLPAPLRGLGSHLDYRVTSYVFPQVHHPCLCQGLSYNPRAEPLVPWFGICDGPRHPRLAFKTFGNTARAAPPRLSLRRVPRPVFLLPFLPWVPIKATVPSPAASRLFTDALRALFRGCPRHSLPCWRPVFPTPLSVGVSSLDPSLL